MTRGPQYASAVALEYSDTGAPRVTVKGHGEVARQIIELEREHNIPLQEDAALNEILSGVELGEEIAPAPYVAVAEVLRFAYSLRTQALPAAK